MDKILKWFGAETYGARLERVRAFWKGLAVRVEKDLGIPQANVLLAATHTHSGPEPAYCDSDQVAAKAFEAVRLAQARLQPARIGAGAGRCNVNINRRARTATGDARGGWWLSQNPDGPSDKTIHVVKFAYDQVSYEIMASDVKRGVERILVGGLLDMLGRRK